MGILRAWVGVGEGDSPAFLRFENAETQDCPSSSSHFDLEAREPGNTLRPEALMSGAPANALRPHSLMSGTPANALRPHALMSGAPENSLHPHHLMPRTPENALRPHALITRPRSPSAT